MHDLIFHAVVPAQLYKYLFIDEKFVLRNIETFCPDENKYGTKRNENTVHIIVNPILLRK